MLWCVPFAVSHGIDGTRKSKQEIRAGEALPRLLGAGRVEQTILGNDSGSVWKSSPSGAKARVNFAELNVRAEARTLQTDPLPGQLHEYGSTAIRNFALVLWDRAGRLGRLPRITSTAADYILGYFRILPDGRTTVCSSVQKQAIIRLPWQLSQWIGVTQEMNYGCGTEQTVSLRFRLDCSRPVRWSGRV